MTREDIRLTNLLRLIARFKTAAALAEASDTNEKYISQIINRHKLPSGNPKNVGSALARRLEKAAGEDPGWMDYDHDHGGMVVTRTDMTPDEAELLRLYRRASSTKKQLMIELGRLKA